MVPGTVLGGRYRNVHTQNGLIVISSSKNIHSKNNVSSERVRLVSQQGV